MPITWPNADLTMASPLGQKGTQFSCEGIWRNMGILQTVALTGTMDDRNVNRT